jgi:flagellar hook-length control protein FliK
MTASLEASLTKLGTEVKSQDTDFSQVMSDSLKSKSTTTQKSADTLQSATSSKQFASTNTVTDTKDVKQTESFSKDDLSDTAKAVEDEVKDLVKEELGLSDEELEEAMTTLGLTLLDLLVPDNMKTLVLEVNGAEPMDLLTDEGLNLQLTDLLQGTGEILENAGLEAATPEELSALLDNLKDALPETFEEALETVSEPKVEIKADKEVVKADEKAEPLTEKTAEPVTTKAEESQSKETKADVSEDNKQQGTKSEAKSEVTQNPLDTIVQNLTENVSFEETSLSAAEQLQTMREIVTQVVEQIKVNIQPGTTSMELTLNPESLGKVNLTVIAKDGHLTASFTAQNQVTKEALESQMQTLKETLTNQGLKVDAIEVNIESFAFDERNQMGKGQANEEQQGKKEKKISVDELLKAFDEEASEEEVLTPILGVAGAMVDYTA